MALVAYTVVLNDSHYYLYCISVSRLALSKLSSGDWRAGNSGKSRKNGPK